MRQLGRRRDSVRDRISASSGVAVAQLSDVDTPVVICVRRLGVVSCQERRPQLRALGTTAV
jgi:hypothetical protein